MKSIKIYNKSKEIILADKAKLANSFINRLVGLLNRKDLDKGEGLYIVPCNSIHSFFMRFIFDAVFINEEMEVIYLIEEMKPNKVSPLVKGAVGVIELPAGVIRNTNTQVGDKIQIKGAWF